jgi:hypothetical protein
LSKFIDDTAQQHCLALARNPSNPEEIIAIVSSMNLLNYSGTLRISRFFTPQATGDSSPKHGIKTDCKYSLIPDVLTDLKGIIEI